MRIKYRFSALLKYVSFALMVISLAVIQPLQMIAHAEGGYTLSGSIKINSVPIPDTYIVFSDGTDTYLGVTDKSGNYTIANMPVGNYTLEFRYYNSDSEWLAHDGSAVGIPYDFNYHSVESGNPYPVTVAGNTSYDVNYQMPVKQFSVVDKYGNPVTGEWIELYTVGTHPDGHDVYDPYTRLTNDNGNTYNMAVQNGADYYGVCAKFTDSRAVTTSPRDSTGSHSAVVTFDPVHQPSNVLCQNLDVIDASQPTAITAPTIAQPTNVHANDTASPSISWNAMAGVDHYNIYRSSDTSLDLIGTSTTNSFVDESRPEGDDVGYSVSAVDADGLESAFSPAQLHQYPKFGAPTWFNNPSYAGIDTFLGIPIAQGSGSVQNVEYTVDGGTPRPMTYSDNLKLWNAIFGADLGVGTHSVTITATNTDGHTSQTTTNLSILDPATVPHMLGTPTWTANPTGVDEEFGGNTPTTLSVLVLPGVAGVEAVQASLLHDCCGDIVIPLDYDAISNSWQVLLGRDTFPVGAFTLRITATDTNGNKSAPVVTTLYVGTQPAALAAPTNLSVVTPTNAAPVLTWNSAAGADRYDVYRDGIKVGSATATNYSDTSANEGSHDYYVKTVNSTGVESNPSNIVTGVYDVTGPTVNHSFSSSANGNGWFNTDVMISFSCVDSLSGVLSCQSPITIGTEGLNQTVSGTSTDNAGNSTTTGIGVNIDKTAPVLASPVWVNNPLQQGQNSTVSIAASDGLSGVESVQYKVGNGASQAMTYDATSHTWRATFGNGLPVGNYSIAITATDKAGNSSQPLNDVLVVYVPKSGSISNHAHTLPTASDTLPIARDTSSNPTKIVFGFNGVKSPAAGNFDIKYVIKNNKNEFTVGGTSVDWVSVPDTTHASMLGHADLSYYVNGVKTIVQGVAVRYDIVKGASGASDHITVKIFSPGVDPNNGIPTYVIDDTTVSSGLNLQV